MNNLEEMLTEKLSNNVEVVELDSDVEHEINDSGINSILEKQKREPSAKRKDDLNNEIFSIHTTNEDNIYENILKKKDCENTICKKESLFKLFNTKDDEIAMCVHHTCEDNIYGSSDPGIQPTELSHLVNNAIILENENISNINEDLLVKKFKNPRNSSSAFRDEIDLRDEEFHSKNVDDSVILLDVIVFDDKWDSICKHNFKNMDNLEEKLIGESLNNVDDAIKVNFENNQSNENYESLICNPIECNTNIRSFDNEIDISSQNHILPLNDDITGLNNFLSLSASEVDNMKIENSDGISESSDINLLFMPSKNDFLKYEIDSSFEENEEDKQPDVEEENQGKIKERNQESVSNTKSCLNTLQSKSKYLSSDSIHHLKNSSVVKDGEDNVTFFYDCDLSYIENADVEEDDKTKLSFEYHTLLNVSILKENKEQSENGNNSSSCVDQNICHDQLKTQTIDYQHVHSSTTNVEQHLNSSKNSPCNDHKNNRIMAKSLLNQQTQLNKCEVQCCMANPSVKANVLNPIDVDFVSVSCSDIKSVSNDTMPIYSSIHDINTVITDNFCFDQTNLNDKIETKSYENETEEKPDINELDLDYSISPHISQTLLTSLISQNALEKKAAANIDLNSMGDKTLDTYLAYQTVTLDVLKVLHKALDTCPSSNILLEDPSGLVVPLMPHQKHAIAWLMWRESQEPHGGILADDMGLGKTLTMISLVLKSEENEDRVPVVCNDNNRNDIINGGTLVVCPSSLLCHWENEARTKLSPGRLKVFQYYGVNRSTSASELAKYDIVTTSYNIIMWDYKKKQYSSPLFEINWKRIILDEAHNIRNPKTQTSVAVCNMTGSNYWALTGTPVHNKESDFFTLLKFIRCKPFDYWPVWKRWVGNNDDAGKYILSLLVKTLMLRRSKKELSQFTSFKLPSKNIHTVEVELSKEERNAYVILLQFSSCLFASYLFDRASKAMLVDPDMDDKDQHFLEQSKENIFKDHPQLLKLFEKYTNIVEVKTCHILVLFLRLRQMCCHPCLIKGKVTEEDIGDGDEEIIPKMEDLSDNDASDNGNVSGILYNDNTTNVVPILNDEITDPIDLTSFLSLKNMKELNKKINTPINDNDIFKKSWQSSKIKAVCDMVWEKVLKDDGREKAIIVSQWSSMLYLIRLHMSQYDVDMEIISRSVPLLKRNKIICEFNSANNGPQILLLSLNAGGVGLNLVAANHMFMVDVHWNPQLEAQVCDRIHRVGQTTPVNIYKFICNNTIETKIMTIQTRKLEIAQNLIEGGASVASSKITLEDLQNIFQI